MNSSKSNHFSPLLLHKGLFGYQRLFYRGPEVFVYILNDQCNEIHPESLIALDTSAGDWSRCASLKGLIKYPERRHLVGTLSSLEPFLEGIHHQVDNVIDAILVYTRGKKLSRLEQHKNHYANDGIACRNCWDSENPFDSCVVFRNSENEGGKFSSACANCIIRQTQDTCEYSRVNEERNSCIYEDGVFSVSASARLGSKENPIDLTNEDTD